MPTTTPLPNYGTQQNAKHTTYHGSILYSALFIVSVRTHSSNSECATPKLGIYELRTVQTRKNATIALLKVRNHPGICLQMVNDTTKKVTRYLVSVPRSEPRISCISSRRPKHSNTTQHSALSKRSDKTRHPLRRAINASFCLKTALNKNQKFQVT